MLIAALMLVAYANCQTTPVPILKQINRVNDDGSYTYGFEAADGTFKVETRDNLGNVKGKYGYVDETGQLRTIEYAAGSPSGFEATGDHVPAQAAAPAVPAAPARPAARPVSRTTARPRLPQPLPAPVAVPAPIPVQQPAPAPVQKPAATPSFLPTPIVSTPTFQTFQTQQFKPQTQRVVPQQFNDIDNSGVNNVRRGFSFAFEAPVIFQTSTVRPLDFNNFNGQQTFREFRSGF